MNSQVEVEVEVEVRELAGSNGSGRWNMEGRKQMYENDPRTSVEWDTARKGRA